MVHQENSAPSASLNAVGSNKVWFITSASRGFGRILAEAALKRGDKLGATARSLCSIADLEGKYGFNVLTLEFDLTNPD